MPTRHDRLFREYAQELRGARLAAEKWWKSLIASETRKLGNRKEAIRSVSLRWPSGPASHPYVLAVLRKHCTAQRQNIPGYGRGRSPQRQRPRFSPVNEPLVILSSGALTAVGLSAAQTCAAIRASITGFTEWDLSHLSVDSDTF